MNVVKRLFRRNEMSCHQVALVMQQYLDRELDAAEVPKVLRHLEACRDCGLEAEVYERIKASLETHRYMPDPASIERVQALANDLAVSGPPPTE